MASIQVKILVGLGLVVGISCIVFVAMSRSANEAVVEKKEVKKVKRVKKKKIDIVPKEVIETYGETDTGDDTIIEDDGNTQNQVVEENPIVPQPSKEEPSPTPSPQPNPPLPTPPPNPQPEKPPLCTDIMGNSGMRFNTQEEAIQYAEDKMLLIDENGWSLYDGYEAWSLQCGGWTVSFYIPA